MSFAALAWAGKCKPGSASRKLVLLALADRHNDEADGAYPSIAWLVEFTDLNRKTVINALSELEASGFISDSGERKGDTRQIKLYRLNIESIPKTEQSQKRNSSEKCAEQSQKRDTDTVRTSSSTKTSSSSRKRASAFVLPSDIPADEWGDYEEMRVVTKKPMTDSIRAKAVARLRKLADAGYPPGDVLSHSTLNNYQGLFPPKDETNGRNTGISMGGNRGSASGRGSTVDAAQRFIARHTSAAGQPI